MRFILTLYGLLFVFVTSFGQEGFGFDNQKEKVKIPFQLINNLIFIPVTINDVPLTFMLDTGVKETVLFSLENHKEVSLNFLEKIKLKGLGTKEAVEAFKSSKNKVNIRGYLDLDHDIYIVTDQDFNISSKVGIPVNGIIGYPFFKNHLVEINYKKKIIVVYEDSNRKKQQKLSKRFYSDSLIIEGNKPYCLMNIVSKTTPTAAKMLLDTGNSDAVWLFKSQTNMIKLPDITITDYLGTGFSGEIYGQRGRISTISFGNIILKNLLAAFPDSTSMQRVNFVSNRLGSIGGEVLSRFTIFLDYQNKRYYTKPNTNINNPFHYNMSGIEVAHAGVEWVEESVHKVEEQKNNTEKNDNSLNTRFTLKPVFVVFNIRKGSAAEEAGLLVNDKIVKINNRPAHNLTIEKINQLLRSEEGNTVEISVERGIRQYKFRVKLKSVI